jgi:hypothetical protein
MHFDDRTGGLETGDAAVRQGLRGIGIASLDQLQVTRMNDTAVDADPCLARSQRLVCLTVFDTQDLCRVAKAVMDDAFGL